MPDEVHRYIATIGGHHFRSAMGKVNVDIPGIEVWLPTEEDASKRATRKLASRIRKRFKAVGASERWRPIAEWHRKQVKASKTTVRWAVSSALERMSRVGDWDFSEWAEQEIERTIVWAAKTALRKARKAGKWKRARRR